MSRVVITDGANMTNAELVYAYAEATREQTRARQRFVDAEKESIESGEKRNVLWQEMRGRLMSGQLPIGVYRVANHASAGHEEGLVIESKQQMSAPSVFPMFEGLQK